MSVPVPPAVRPVGDGDRDAVDAFLHAMNSDVVARLGELVDARRHPALLGEVDGRLAGVLTYVVRGDACEVLTLHAVEHWNGVGSALIDVVRLLASDQGCARLWLVTTNDNVDALRFYQRRGFRLARLHAGAVDRSRATIKPTIPEIGAHGIRLRDELELELDLRALE